MMQMTTGTESLSLLVVGRPRGGSAWAGTWQGQHQTRERLEAGHVTPDHTRQQGLGGTGLGDGAAPTLLGPSQTSPSCFGFLGVSQPNREPLPLAVGHSVAMFRPSPGEGQLTCLWGGCCCPGCSCRGAEGELG